MRRVSALLFVMILLGSAGGVAAQAFQSLPHRDLSFEYQNVPADDNGLPPPDNAQMRLVLDGKTFVGTNAALGDVDPSLRYGVPVNEWVVPLVYEDGTTGYRTKSFIVPGVTRFQAMFGLWQDRNGDRFINITSDAANEWIGFNSTMKNPANTSEEITNVLEAYVEPGYHPSATSDWYILADMWFTEQSSFDNESDFAYGDAAEGNGHWIGAAIIPFFGIFTPGIFTDDDHFDGSLLKEHIVHTVANGFKNPSTAPGYTCTGATRCLFDIDRYDVLSPEVALLYETTVDTIDQVYSDTFSAGCDPAATVFYDCPVIGREIDEADNESDRQFTEINKYNLALQNAALNATFYSEDQEDANPPVYFGIGGTQVCVSSMTQACGVARKLADGVTPDPNGYNYQADWQAWIQMEPWAYYTGGPGTGTLAVAGHGVAHPSDLKARGVGPMILGIQTNVGFWYDENKDTYIGNETTDSTPADDYATNEWAGTCDAFRISTGRKITQVNVTLEPVNDVGGPTTWGTTGAYIFQDKSEFPGTGDRVSAAGRNATLTNWWDDAIMDVLTDGRADRLKISGPITLQIFPDEDDCASGDWFANASLLLPQGTKGFNLKVTMESDIGLKIATGLRTGLMQAVREIDVYPRWDD